MSQRSFDCTGQNRASHDGMLISMASFIVVIAGVKAASSLIIPLLLATFIAVILSPLLLWLTKKGVPSALALMTVLLVLMLVWVIMGALIGTSFKDFSESLPFYQERLTAMYGQLLAWARARGMSEQNLEILKEVDPSQVMHFAASTLRGLGKLVTNTFFIFLTLLFMLIEAGGMNHKMRLLARLGIGSESQVENIFSGINSFFAIKTLTSMATGLLIGLALWIQGVDFPVLWGLLAFLLNYIPNIGSIIAAVPAVLLAFVQLGAGHAMVSAVIFLVVNTLIGSIVEPRVMGSGVGLSPLVVFLSMAFWGWVFGPVGMLLSVPLTMLFKIALSRSDSGRWLSVLLGTNKEAEQMLRQTVEADRAQEDTEEASDQG